jgi:hypothetical protein
MRPIRIFVADIPLPLQRGGRRGARPDQLAQEPHARKDPDQEDEKIQVSTRDAGHSTMQAPSTAAMTPLPPSSGTRAAGAVHAARVERGAVYRRVEGGS